MQSTQSPQDERSVIDRFKQLDGGVKTIEEYNKTGFVDLDVDGRAWTYDNVIILIGPEVTQIDVPLDKWSDGEYVGTEYPGEKVNATGYGFASDEHVHYVPAEQVRMLANEVFDVSYKTMRASAQTTDELDGHVKDNPVIFDPPQFDVRVGIAPLIRKD